MSAHLIPAMLQQLIMCRDYPAIMHYSQIARDAGTAARLRLICNAIDTTAVFGKGPHEGAPQSVNDLVRAAHDLLATPNLAKWALTAQKD